MERNVCFTPFIADGKICAADEDITKIEEMYFPILKIIREEILSKKYVYAIRDKVQIYLNDALATEVPTEEFNQEADYLYHQIFVGGNRAFSVERTEEFMHKIFCNRLAAPSTDKTDITI